MSAPVASLPAWLQAVAGLLSFAATAWLAYLTSRYVRATDDIAKSTQRQVTDALALAQQSRRGLAASLRAEVSRINVELGPEPEENGPHLPHRGMLVPQVHPWFTGVIPSLGSVDAEAVAQFLALDRDLHNYKVAHDNLAKSEEALEAKQKEHSVFEGIYKHSGTKLTDLQRETELRRDIRVADENLQRAYAFAGTEYKKCKATVGSLVERLSRLAE